jgi:hypothetical protein
VSRLLLPPPWLRLAEYLKDVYSEFEHDWYCGGGLTLRSDYAQFFGSPAVEPTVERPFLMSIQREEGLRRPGLRWSAMFVDHPARLGLRSIHRELLERALVGETDEEIARSLCLSTPTVKWRWRQIYDGVEDRLPDLYRAWGEGVRARGYSRRGAPPPSPHVLA